MERYRSYFAAFVIVLLNVANLPGRIPGHEKGYFQQEVNHRIHVTLDDMNHELHASETIEYINNSPDTLGFLYFHLWPNAYSGNHTPLAKQLFRFYGKRRLFNDPLKAGYIDSLDFSVDGIKASWHLIGSAPDICMVMLPEKLRPGDTIYISTPFHVKIPEGNISRLGHTGYSYQVSQWYPKPAVYDMKGWHPISYLDQGEFFSEYGEYEVFITLPGDYTTGATGDLVTETENRRLEDLSADTISVHVPSDRPSTEQLKTICYRALHVHDFAWFADRDFLVRKGSIVLPGSGREVITYAMFTPSSGRTWEEAIKYINRAVSMFSVLIGEYPYNTFTAVYGSLGAGSGMEYPGLTVVGPSADAYLLDEVLAHEVCHSWFYSSLGSDERTFPYMDEGITSAYEDRYMDIYWPGVKLWEIYLRNQRLARFLKIDYLPATEMEELDWLAQARNNLDQPVQLPSGNYTGTNYANVIYFKAGKGFNLLRSYLGDSIFDSAIQDYYDRWNGRHPYPEDLEKAFTDAAGRNIDWFFSGYLGDSCGMDYSAQKLKGDSILVWNKGTVAAPFEITWMDKNRESTIVWYEGFHGKRWLEMPRQGLSAAVLNAGHELPELNYLNNNIKKPGIFRKADRLRATILFALEDPDAVTLMYTPLVNWTKTDGFMIGAALNNGILLPKSMEYTVMPFFRFREPGISGKGKITFNFIPCRSTVRKISFSLEGLRFGAPSNTFYYALSTGTDLYFKNYNPVTGPDSRTWLRVTAASDLLLADMEANGTEYFLETGYAIERLSLLNPYSCSAFMEAGRSFVKTSMVIKYLLSYNYRNTGLDVRLFSGLMIESNPGRPFYSLAPAGRSGRELYLFTGDFPDRFSVFPAGGFWSRQMMITEGGLVSPVNDSTGYSKWLLSASLSSSLPGKAGRLPVSPFCNLLLNDHSFRGSPIMAEAGVKAGFPGLFEIYIPVIVSENIRSVYSNSRDRIRFVLTLDSFFRLRLSR